MSTTLHPDDIDASFVARVVPDCFESTIGDEAVVVAGHERVLALNGSAAMVFEFLDGATSIDELVDDFSDVLGLERAEVEAQLVGFVRQLGWNGLLQDVDAGGEDQGFQSDAFDVGDSLAELRLVDGAGERFPLPAPGGRQVALLNWSVTCGFCSTILPQLAGLAGPLAAQGVDLVFLTAGDLDGNREQLVEAGIDAPVVRLGGADERPFGSLGTPALLLVGPDAAVTEPVVLGANLVPERLAALAGTTGDDEEPTARYLPAPAAMCGPGGGAASGPSSEWLGTRVYALGDAHVGIRYNSETTAALLDRLFPGARVDDARAPDNYSVSLADERDARTRSLDLLVRGSRQLARSRSSRRVLTALVSQLSAELALPMAGAIRADAAVVLHGDGAVLLPAAVLDGLSQVQSRLARAGYRIADVPYATIDLSSGELVVPEPAVEHDATVLAALDDGGAREPAAVEPGRYRLDRWCIVRTPDRIGPLSPASAVASALPLVHDSDDLVALVDGLADLFRGGVEALGIWYTSVDELLEQL